MSWMFRDTASFNQDLSAWNVSKVHNMSLLFSGASAFNSSLCAWGSQLSATTNVTGMFLNTSCLVMDDPDLDRVPRAPFCHVCMNETL